MGRSLQTIILVCILVVGSGLVFVLSNSLEEHSFKVDPTWVDQDLYLSAEQTKSLSGDFRGLVADWYWMSALQYAGKKIVDAGGLQGVNTKDLRALNLKMLYPMLDRATTLDPGYRVAYQFGAVVLPGVNVDQAIKLTEKGMADDPNDWVLYQHLGFIYWDNKEYDKASEVYAKGAEIPNAPDFLKQMSAKVKLEGGSHEVAREIYQHIYDTAEDTSTRDLVGMRLLQLDSLEEREAVQKAMQAFAAANKRCPTSWSEIFSTLRNVKLPNGRGLMFKQPNIPVDPSGAAYLISNTNETCGVKLDPVNTKIPPG